MRSIFATCVAALMMSSSAIAAEAFSIRDAILQAVTTNPTVGEAAANRRATEAELRQVQSTLLPQVRLEGRYGPEKFNNRDLPIPPAGNDTWLNGRSVSVYARQLVFDGFTTLNEIWRQTARVDAGAHRTRERSELIALDAAEAYIEVVRYTRLITIAVENLAAHRRIYGNVNSRFQGGRAGEGDLQQAAERVAAAEAILADFRRSLEDGKAKFRKAVGIEPHNLRSPGRLPGLPRAKDDALAVTLRHNPTIQSAQSDSDAAKYGFHATSGAFVPTVALEGRAKTGIDSDGYIGRRDELSGKIVATWDVFRGGQDVWRRTEMGERFIESGHRLARLQRDAFESVDRAWAARTVTVQRIAALMRQVDADRKVIVAFGKEYDLGQRSLIDLLNAQNQLLNGLVSLESTRAVAIFADYQLLATMGQLLSYMKTTHPIDAEPLVAKPYGLIPFALPAIWIDLPQPGIPEPINVSRNAPLAGFNSPMVPAARGIVISSRWPTTQDDPKKAFARWIPQGNPATQVAAQAASSGHALSFASQNLVLPPWPIKDLR
jgi:adhesin transport system outer membrane protein